MATPFDDRIQQSQMSSIASQTSLAGAYDPPGRSWTGKRSLSRKSSSQRTRLPKIKSSPSQGALAVARANEERMGRHKRGNSISNMPTSPTFVPDYLLQSAGSIIPTAHAEPLPEPKKPSKVKKIKPLLTSKFSSQEQLTIDLSRSAADNEALAAVYNSEINNSALPKRTDSASMSQHRSGYHHRTTSTNSQVSTSTATSSRYVHPMRQTPRAYTPPMAGSYKTSFDSDSTPMASDFDTSTSTPYAPPAPPSTNTSISTTTHHRNKLPHIRTTSSNTTTTTNPRLTSTPSLTNLHNPPTPSSLRHPAILPSATSPTTTAAAATGAHDIISPVTHSHPTTARSSLESSTFRKTRSRSNTAQTDPAQQAATVQDLRRKFQEKEARKDAKYREAEQRVAEKEMRRRERREGRNRSRANSEKSSLRSMATFGTREGGGGPGRMGGKGEMEEVGERERFDPKGLGVEMFGRDVQALREQTSGTFVAGGRGGGMKGLGTGTGMGGKQQQFAMGAARDVGGGGSGIGGAGEKVEKVKGGWSLFWFRCKTMWLKMTGRGRR